MLQRDTFEQSLSNCIAQLEAVRDRAQTHASTFDKAIERARGALVDAKELVKENQVLNIGVVGQVKAGKSSFLNALFFEGESILPKASTPMTAGLTELCYSEENKLLIEYYSRDEWGLFMQKEEEYQNFRKCGLEDGDIDSSLREMHELVERAGAKARAKIEPQARVETVPFEGVKELQGAMEQYVGAKGDFTSVVKCLRIYLNDERLKNLKIVDTPGVSDPIISREMRTREYLRCCHGVFFLSQSSRFFDATDQGFLSERIDAQGVGAVVMIASKFDSVLQDEGQRYHDNLQVACVNLIKQLRDQFERNLAGIKNYTGPKPELTQSSGIGYSIATKPRDTWDDTEQHVYQRMQKYYPSFFREKENQDLATFKFLSQIDEIQEKYIRELFVSKKEELIATKCEGFFRRINDGLSTAITGCQTALESELEMLKTSDLDSLRREKRNLKDNLAAIEAGVKGKIDNCSSALNKFPEEARKLKFSSVQVPVRWKEKTFKHKGALWGLFSGETEISYELVDTTAYIEKVQTELLEKAQEKLEKRWQEQISKIEKEIEDVVLEALTDSERRGEGPTKLLRQELSNLLSALNQESKGTGFVRTAIESAINGFRQELQSRCRDIRSDIGTGCSSSEVVERVSDWSDDKKEEARALQDSAFQTYCTEMEGLLKKKVEELHGTIQGYRDKLIEGLGKRMEMHFGAVEEKLKEKESAIEELESLLGMVKQIKI